MTRRQIAVSEILSTSFETEPFHGVDRAAKRRPISIQVKEDGLHFTVSTGDEIVVSVGDLSDWHFEGRYVYFVYAGLSVKPHPKGDRLVDGSHSAVLIQLQSSEVKTLQRQFNLLRIRSYLELMDEERLSCVALVQCAECGLVYDGEGEGAVSFCPECLSMVSGGRNLCIEGGYLFNFCKDGWFDFLGCDGDQPRSLPAMVQGEGFLSFRSLSRPYLAKIGSHGLWMSLWGLLWWPAARLPQPYNYFAGYLLLFLLFASCVFAGSYLLTLFFKGWLRPVVMLPRWARLILRMRRFRSAELRGLEEHPGFLSNMALRSRDLSYLERAISLCPTHPALLELMASLSASGGWDQLHRVALRRAALIS